MDLDYQAAIIGGGPAGLQAALTLGRMHVRTLVYDDARYRNGVSPRMGNVLGWDGADPVALRAAAHSELTAFPWVQFVAERVATVRTETHGVTVSTAGSERRAGRLLIASGVEDTLLPIPGARELWGDVVLPCPYCHGHEFASGTIAVISDGGHAQHVSRLLSRMSPSVPVLRPETVLRLERSTSGVRIALRDGTAVDAGSVFIPPNPVPRSSLADALGVRSGPDGIEVDVLGRTNAIGVWAAGDVARRANPRIPAAVVSAMASGLIAAADIASDIAEAGGARDPAARPAAHSEAD